jgi:hypothetical protein
MIEDNGVCLVCPAHSQAIKTTGPAHVACACSSGYANALKDIGAINCITPDWTLASSCKDDEYLNDTDADKYNHTCERCPRGGFCEISTATWSTLRPLFGWWQIPEAERYGNNVQWKSTVRFAKCLYSPACLGAPNRDLEKRYFSASGEDLASVDAVKTTGKKNTSFSPRCATALGFRNASRLCQACKQGFVRSLRSQCTSCEADSPLSLMIAGIFLLLLGYVAIVGMKLRSFGRLKKFDATRHHKAIHSTLKRIILTHIQTIVMVLGLAVKWPPLVMSLMSVVSAVSSISENGNAVACFFHGAPDHAGLFYALLIVASLLPLVISCFLAVYWLVLVPHCDCQGKCKNVLACGIAVAHREALSMCQSVARSARGGASDENGNSRQDNNNSQHDNNSNSNSNSNNNNIDQNDRFQPSTADMFISSSVLIWFLTLPSLVRMAFGVFECRFVGEPAVGKPMYLLASMEEPCWRGRHVSYLYGIAVPMLVGYGLVVPGLILLRLRRVGDARLTDPSLLLRWGLMHSGYTKEKFWWEGVVLLRKYTVIAVSVTIVSAENQLQFVLGVLVVSQYMQSVFAPFGQFVHTQRLLHWAETTSLCVLMLMIWAGVYFSFASDLCTNTQEGWCSLLVVLILATNMMYLLVVGGKCCSAWLKRKNVRKKFAIALARARQRKGQAQTEERRREERRREGHCQSNFVVDLNAVGLEMTVNPTAGQSKASENSASPVSQTNLDSNFTVNRRMRRLEASRKRDRTKPPAIAMDLNTLPRTVGRS